MDKEKQQKIVEKCLNFMTKAEEVLECPICYNNSKEMVQCLTGHHVCHECQKKLNICPLCNNKFLGTKSFLMDGITDALSNIKLSLSNLEHDINETVVDNGIETYRKLLKEVLFEFSSYCYRNKTFLLFLNKYLQNPAACPSNELEKQLIKLTSDLRNLAHIINNTEATLIVLKKK
ncbi:uncharacterized protein LOC131664587 [Phymastichus coffea]|uniref:uncharacterized protein LOC131664587 n=1 Tax=Phymastichus coffea TaxID=108790 RepID=UPI00273B86AE|nr:uncharacterized protein LOC131664587 [Phymastichus coffea]